MGLDDREPVALEQFAVVWDLPVAVLQACSLGAGELGERRGVVVVVEVGVVGEAGGEEDDAGVAGHGVDEALFLTQAWPGPPGLLGARTRGGTCASRRAVGGAGGVVWSVGWRRARNMRL